MLSTATLLVADDEVDTLSLLAFRLQKLGYRVLTASEGRSAMSLIQAERPDLVFLDIHLPIMDGYEVCRRVRADETLKETRVIFSTADVCIKIHEAIQMAGADGYLLKPYESEEVLHAIRTHLAWNKIIHPSVAA